MKSKEKLLKTKDVAWILDWNPDDVSPSNNEFAPAPLLRHALGLQ